MNNANHGPHGYNSGPYTQQPHAYDSSGQVIPPGVVPRCSATLWEDEGTLCYQVEVKGVCVARRDGMSKLQFFSVPSCALLVYPLCCLSHFPTLTFGADNHFINGTKLLNVAGMTRGRRDGILKSEKTRHVVKIGPMHLKGVWYVYAVENGRETAC
jgi:protein SOK2